MAHVSIFIQGLRSHVGIYFIFLQYDLLQTSMGLEDKFTLFVKILQTSKVQTVVWFVLTP